MQIRLRSRVFVRHSLRLLVGELESLPFDRSLLRGRGRDEWRAVRFHRSVTDVFASACNLGLQLVLPDDVTSAFDEPAQHFEDDVCGNGERCCPERSRVAGLVEIATLPGESEGAAPPFGKGWNRVVNGGDELWLFQDFWS